MAKGRECPEVGDTSLLKEASSVPSRRPVLARAAVAGATAVAGGLVVASTPVQDVGAATFPGNTASYYAIDANTNTWETLGCSGAQADIGVGYRYVMIDFGRQVSGGFLDFSGGGFVSDAAAEQSVESYGKGWYACAAAGETLEVALGTSNDYLDEAGTGGASNFGIELGQDVSVINSYLSTQGYAALVGAYGSNDIEPAYSSFAVASSWETGYSEASTRAMFFFGSCDGCPTSGGGSSNQSWAMPDANGNTNTWTDAYMKSLSTSGIPEDVSIPQIYEDTMADQWKNISNYCNASLGYAIDFLGTMTSSPATWSPSSGWSALQSLTGSTSLGATNIEDE